MSGSSAVFATDDYVVSNIVIRKIYEMINVLLIVMIINKVTVITVII